MRIMCGIVLSITLVTIFFYSYRKNRDIFSPLCIFSLFQFLRYVPKMFSAEVDSGVILNDDNILKTFLIEMLFVIVVCISCNISKDNSVDKRYCVKRRTNTIPLYVVCLIFIIGFMCRLRLIYEYGGVQNIYINLKTVYLAQGSGSGFRMILEKLMLVATMMQLERIGVIGIRKTIKSIGNIMILFIMIVASMWSYLVFSSRSPALELLMIVIFGYNYLISKVNIKKIFTIKGMFIATVILLIILIMPMIRKGNYVEINLTDAVDSIFDEFSYVGRDTKVYEYYNYDNYWFGKSYLSLATAFIPSSLFTNKPVVDDGIYLCNIIYGIDTEPLKSLNEIRMKFSIPFSSQGITYANIGILGVIIGAIISGVLYSKVYKLLKDTHEAWVVILYQLIVYQFDLSTLGIMQVLMPLATTYFIYKIITGMKIIKVKER